MAAPKIVAKESVNTTESTVSVDTDGGILLQNDGGQDIMVTFDGTTVTTTESFIVGTGTTDSPIRINNTDITNIKHKTKSGSSVLKIIKLNP